MRGMRGARGATSPERRLLAVLPPSAACDTQVPANPEDDATPLRAGRRPFWQKMEGIRRRLGQLRALEERARLPTGET